MKTSNGKRKPKTNRAGDASRSLMIDSCQTPPYAVVPLIPFLQRGWTIWESAAGEGLLASALRNHGQTVVESDILTGQNFFEYQPDVWDIQITNPPYSIKYRWLKRSYELGKSFALLMPVDVLGAKSAQDLFRVHGVEVIFLDARVDFKMPNTGWDGSAQFAVAWFTWGLWIGREMTFAHLPKPSAQRRAEYAIGVEQLGLFEEM